MLLVLVVACGTAQAQWKWRDANGRLQVSDLPPPTSVPDRDILQRPKPPAAGTGSATAIAPAGNAASAPVAAPSAKPLDAELEKKRKAEEQERAAKTKADEERRQAQRADNCARARSAAATMESGQRVTRLNEKGEREFLDDRQRAEEARRAREVISADCR